MAKHGYVFVIFEIDTGAPKMVLQDGPNFDANFCAFGIINNHNKRSSKKWNALCVRIHDNINRNKYKKQNVHVGGDDRPFRVN